MNIFEQATKQGLRFPSIVGELSTEQLWDLPLTSRSLTERPPSLDAIARAVHAELKDKEEVSFVDIKPDPRKAELELQLEILKHIIQVKKDERDAAKRAVENAERRKMLTAALASKQEASLLAMSEEELRAELAKHGE